MEGVVKLIDFGTSTKVVEINTCRRSGVGTPWYTAPEVSQPVDCHACFVLLLDPHSSTLCRLSMLMSTLTLLISGLLGALSLNCWPGTPLSGSWTQLLVCCSTESKLVCDIFEQVYSKWQRKLLLFLLGWAKKLVTSWPAVGIVTGEKYPLISVKLVSSY